MTNKMKKLNLDQPNFIMTAPPQKFLHNIKSIAVRLYTFLKKINWQLVIGICALGISYLAVISQKESLQNERNNVRLSVNPFIESQTAFTEHQANRYGFYGIKITNNGLGPALIYPTQVFKDGQLLCKLKPQTKGCFTQDMRRTFNPITEFDIDRIYQIVALLPGENRNIISTTLNEQRFRITDIMGLQRYHYCVPYTNMYYEPLSFKYIGPSTLEDSVKNKFENEVRKLHSEIKNTALKELMSY